MLEQEKRAYTMAGFNLINSLGSKESIYGAGIGGASGALLGALLDSSKTKKKKAREILKAALVGAGIGATGGSILHHNPQVGQNFKDVYHNIRNKTKK